MKIYTRTGDLGETGLFGGQRVSKTHPRVEAYGAVDELNAVLGLACADLPADPGGGEGNDVPTAGSLAAWLRRIQMRLFDIGADLATPPETDAGRWLERVSDTWVGELEADIDRRSAELESLQSFIVPGGSRAAATLHLARTVCRRAERRAVAAIQDHEEDITPNVVRYLNRLSDWLFVAARQANADSGVADIPWRPRSARD